MTSAADDRVAQIRARAEAAHAEVHRLCEGARWTMQVPARPERDSDLVISAALGDIPYLLDQLAEAERNLASVHETMQDALRSNELIREMAAGFMAERDEARRQLAEATDPAAGPFALYVDGSCWGNGYETLDLALGDALEAISDRGSIDGVEIRAVATLGAQQ